MTNLQTRLLQKMTLAGKLSLFIIAVSFSTGMVLPEQGSTPLTKMAGSDGFHNEISFRLVGHAIEYKLEASGKVSGMRMTGNH